MAAHSPEQSELSCKLQHGPATISPSARHTQVWASPSSLPEQVWSSQAGNNQGENIRFCFSAKSSIVYKPRTDSTGLLPLQQSSPLPRFCVASSPTHQLQLFTISVTHLPFTTHDFDRDLGCYLWAFFLWTNLAFLSLSFVNDDKQHGIPAEMDFCRSRKFKTQGSPNYDLNLSPSFSPPGIAQLE